ncbi:MAG: hypothetical protein JWQ27_2122 [Ferruginibacter sp.]|nr:hypothetical protein [Ferruginibacter sp.]
MKKLLLLLVITLGVEISVMAQTDQVKVKKTSTPTQKVHNTFSKHKRYKGYKVKHTNNGQKSVHKVDMKKGKVTTKVD